MQAILNDIIKGQDTEESPSTEEELICPEAGLYMGHHPLGWPLLFPPPTDSIP